ncbi:hypothetical protein V8F06_003034 [Rhypophila decipiens]
MDPSSFASAAASLLGVTIQITGSLYGNWEYSSRVLAERLIYQLLQLRDVLQSLEATALSVTTVVNPPPQDLLLCLEDTKTCLISLGSKLLRQDSQSVFSFQDWPLPWRSFMSSQGSRIPLSPAEATADIQRLQACLSKLNASIAKSVFAPPEELVPKLVADPTGALWKDRAEYVDFHENARKYRLDGTGRWFVNHSKFQNWLTVERAPNTLFCPGMPGSGKTILTSSAIDEVRKWQKDTRSPPNIGLAYFYFSYKTPSLLRNVALALLEQLYLQSSSKDEQVEALEDLATKGNDIPFCDIVSAVTAARLLASSRPHLTFDIFNNSSPTIIITPSEQDIILYADYRLQALPTRNDSLHDEIVAAALETGKRHRMFLLIVMQLNEILSKTTEKEIRRELVKNTGRLHDVYQDLLSRIQAQEEYMVQIATRTLAWLYYAQRPLETSEMLEVHRQANPEVEVDASLVVKSCMGWVVSEPKIAFAHFSVKEFLEDSPVGDESSVALDCLHAVGRIANFDTVDNLKKSDPLLSYAASYWGCHLRNLIGNPGFNAERLKGLCLYLLQDELKVSVLCHIVFKPLRLLRNGVTHHGLINSSRLHLAAYFGLDWAIDKLIDSVDSATNLDEWKRTPLHIAAEKGFDECVGALLLARISPDHEDAGGRTAWHYAAMSGNPKSIDRLIEWKDRTPNAGRPSLATALGADRTGSGKSPLEYAAVNGNAEAFHALFRLYTRESGNNEEVKLFIANAMTEALLGRKKEIVEYLLSNDQAPNYEHLLVATKAGYEDIVQLVLEFGVEVNNPAKDGASAIFIAARKAHNKILQLLLWNGAHLGGIDEQVQDALSSAVKSNNSEGVPILLEAGAEPTSSVDGSEKLIAHAARHGMMKIVQLLLTRKAEATEAAFATVETGQTEILRLLLEHGVPADLKSEAGQSLLETAREADNPAIVQLLEGFDSNPAPRVVSLAPPDCNLADIQTSQGRGSRSYSEDAALPDKPWQTPILEQKEAVSPPLEVPRSTDNAGTEGTKYAAPESSVVKYVPATTNVPSLSMPSTSQPPMITWAPTHEDPRAASGGVMRLGGSVLGINRGSVSRGNGNPVPFLLLSEPIEMGKIGLGSVVVAPRDPLSGYAPEDPYYLSFIYEAIEGFRDSSVQHDYESISDRRSATLFALEVLRPILKFESSQSRSIRIAAPKVSRQRLHNHERALDRILEISGIRQNILSLMKKGPNRKEERKELFLVVGLLVATDMQTAISQEAAHGSNSMTAFSKSVGSQVSHQGDKIFAISYRSLKTRTRSFFARGQSDTEQGVSLGDYHLPESHERLL